MGASSVADQNEKIHCPICQSRIADETPTRDCPECGTRYHQECWEENQGCGVYGCSEVPPTEKWSDHEIPVTYWGRETKDCPQCQREIRATALRCVHCGTTFKSAGPSDAQSFRDAKSFESRRSSLQKKTIALFVLNIIPFTAPLGLVGGGIWTLLNRRHVRNLSGVYRTLCYLGLGLGFLQIALFAAFAGLYSLSH